MIKALRSDRDLLILVAAFAAVYLVWGSTYLAIRYAIESMPPLLMLGSRFGIAGIALFAWLRLRGVDMPDQVRLIQSTIIGILTVGLGTGSIAWAEQYISSGLAALLLTTTPIFMVLLEWKWKRGPRPSAVVLTGLALGLIGVIVLVDPAGLTESLDGTGLAIVAVLLGAVSWSIGSLYGRGVRIPRNPFMNTAIQMMMGGAFLTFLGGIRGEFRTLEMSSISVVSWAAWAYLLVFGSLVAFSAYVWLLENAAAGQVSTYAFVNPIVAVFLGWSIGGEPMTARILLAIVILVSAVILISRFGGRRSAAQTTIREINRPESTVDSIVCGDSELDAHAASAEHPQPSGRDKRTRKASRNAEPRAVAWSRQS